jgi:galactonate dehydratase
MKITSVRPWLIKSGASYWGEFLFVEVSTDEGITGWGEITTTTKIANRALTAMLRQIDTMIVGEDPAQIERLWHKLFRSFTYMGSRGAAVECLSAIDIALWDLCATRSRSTLTPISANSRARRASSPKSRPS